MPSLWRADGWDGDKGDGTRHSSATRQTEEVEDQGVMGAMLLCRFISPIWAALMPFGMVVQVCGGQRAIRLLRGMAESTADSRKVREQVRKS